MIYYSHVNEDSSVEKELLAQTNSERLICIAGSGERVISLLDNSSILKVDIVDFNKEALFLTELKICALMHLEVISYLSFIGFNSSGEKRIDQFETFSDKLSPECFKYWRKRSFAIENGICYAGHFEKFLNRIRPLLSIFLGRKFYQCFYLSKDQWDGFPYRRWQLLKRLFSQRIIFFLAGMRDPSFISKGVQLDTIPSALQKTLDAGEVESSAFFHLIFKGHLRDMPVKYLPNSFNHTSLTRIKARLAEQLEVTYHRDDIMNYIKSHEISNTRNYFYSLSDILSFVNLNYCLELLAELELKCKNHCMVVLRSFVKNRLEKDDLIELARLCSSLEDVSENEMSRMYQVINLGL